MWRLRGNKFGAKKVQADGYTFDSKAEALRYDELQLLEKIGRIQNLEVHPEFVVIVKGAQVCKVLMDFRYWDDPSEMFIIEDVKGKDNAMSRLKRKLVEAQYGIKVRLISTLGSSKSRASRSRR